MEKLESKTWGEHFLSDIFNVDSGKRLETRNKIPGNRPFIGATDNNNGVTGFVGNDNASKDGNVLGVTYNGAPGIAFYHPYECLFTDDVKRLHFKNIDDDGDTYLFFPPIFAKQSVKFGYGYKFNGQRMLRQKLMLPTTPSGEPDYAYMSEYVQSQRTALLEKYKAHCLSRLSALSSPVDIPSLSNKEWQPFPISDLFDLERGREGNMAELDSGEIPLISARNINNGLKGFVSNPKRIYKGNCITLNNDGDGGAGLAYYQPGKMALDTHVTALYPKQNLNQYTLLFIVNCLSELHGFFGHGLSISTARAKNIRIMLPTSSPTTPDFPYMEQYVKNLMIRKYNQYLSYISHQ